MNERKDMGALNSILRNKMVVIATVAAVAMILGAMSVGAAVFDHHKLPGIIGDLPASANPFARQIRTERHALEGGAVEPQVAAAETEAEVQATPQASIAPTAVTDTPVTLPTTTPATPHTNPPALPSSPIDVPAAPVVRPVVSSAQNLVSPIIPDPAREIINGITHKIPTKVETGIVNITLPKIGL